jgi:hypothetical protein
MLLITASDLLQAKSLLILSQSNPFKRNDQNQNTANLTVRAQTQAQHFYRYWPYLPRMTHQVAYLMKRNKMAESLTQSPLFLTLSGFKNVTEAFIPIIPVGEEMLRYLQTLFKLTFIPYQLASDLMELKGRHSPLSPGMLREKLKRAGMDRTLGTLEGANALLIVSLLMYATADAIVNTCRQGQGQGQGQGLQFDVVSSRNAWKDLAGHQSSFILHTFIPSFLLLVIILSYVMLSYLMRAFFRLTSLRLI